MKYPEDSKCQQCGKKADLRPAGETDKKLWICLDCSEKNKKAKP
jgi:ribosomal protein L37AE/L43A